MSDTAGLTFMVVVGTIVLLLFVGFVGMLLVVNTARRHRHRADLAAAELQRETAVMQAEREATEQTLSEVGRELHDSVGQLLTVAQMGLLNHLEENLSEESEVAEALDALEQGIAEVRRLGRTLNSDTWQERNLVEALEADAARLERVGRIPVRFTVEGDLPELPADVKAVLFRTYQEVTNNTLKHSGATALHIAVANPPFSLSLSDNGKGFDPDAVDLGSGLVNIQRRCALIGFAATLTTAPGTGCTWTITQQA